jgi:hypothetical protein
MGTPQGKGETMRILFLCAAMAALAVTGCGRRETAKETAAPAAAAVLTTPNEAALRTQAGRTYADFAATPGMERYAAEHLDLGTPGAARFSRSMAVATPGAIVSANDVTALVFTGCMQHNCGGTLSVLAIDVATGDAFVGVKDEDGETVLKSNARLQMLLTSTSPTHAWTNPKRS